MEAEPISQSLNTLAWKGQEYFSSLKDEKPTKESEYRTWTQRLGWILKMNFDKAPISWWDQWEESESSEEQQGGGVPTLQIQGYETENCVVARRPRLFYEEVEG